ncbi:MAG: sulfatase [Bacteroidota bacterium]
MMKSISANAVLLTLIFTFSCGESTTPVSSENKPPNILFVLADDQSWLHTSISGDKNIKTPGFDRIAREGVLFRNAFTSSPSCTASRSAILTGQDFWRTREAGLLMGSIPKDLNLFSHQLNDAGFHVGYTGKGWAPGNWSYLGLEMDPLVQAYNDRLEVEIAYGIDRRDYTSNFRDFLKDRKEGEPFFFWFGSTEPHREYQYGVGEKEASLDPSKIEVPEFWPDDEIVRKDILDYYYEIMWYDSHLLGMIDELEKIGELDNTIIIVTSDNGMPFPRAKVNLYDWGTHMPLAIRWGKNIPGGRVVDDLVSLTDVAPTILEAAGIDIPMEMTGRSLMPLLKSDKGGIIDASRDQVFFGLERHTYCRPDGATYPSRAIRTMDYIYIRNFEPDRYPTGGPLFISSNKTTHGDVDACPTKTFILANQEMGNYYDLNFGKRPPEELYEIISDPGQVKNLADNPKFSEIRAQLSKRLEDYLVKTEDPRIVGQDPWKDYIYHQQTGFGSTYNAALPDHQRLRARLRPSDHPDLKQMYK